MKQKKQLRIGLYSPYLPKHFGGGERYLFSVAEYLARGHEVNIAIPNLSTYSPEQIEEFRSKYEQAFGLQLGNLQFIDTPLGTHQSIWSKLKWTRQFDVLYYVTDGSLFFSLAKRNILHIQIPFKHSQEGFLNRVKLRNWHVKNANSVFTKDVVERTWRTKIDVVHSPFVDTDQFHPGERTEKIILHVGRFFTHLHAKRQDALVKVFKQLIKKELETMKDWKLVLIGAVEDQQYAQEVTRAAAGFPIEIIHDVSGEMLQSYYRRAKIYWHATGLDDDEYLHPEKMEHFGITTLEAMASGCVPVVINKGGQSEIVEHGVSGYLWNDLEALQEKTLAIIKGEVEWKELSEHARERAEAFNKDRFYQQIDEMVQIGPCVLTPPPLDQVSVVMPNYNGQALMEKHLPAVLNELQAGDEVIVVDDASTDESFKWLKSHFELKEQKDRASFFYEVYQGKWKAEHDVIEVKVVWNKQNVRFAESCNRGVKEAEHDLIWLLNTDVQVKQGVRAKLVRWFRTNIMTVNRVFGVGCLEIERAGQEEVHGGKNRLWFERGLFQHGRASEFATGETAWVSGGSGMFDRRKWQELGGFDVAYYPAYWEDIDLSFRAREIGWRVLFDAEAEVWHNHETTNRDAFGEQRMQVMSFKNSLTFTWKHANLLQRVKFFLWLPYHLTITNRRTNWAFGRSMLWWLGVVAG